MKNKILLKQGNNFVFWKHCMLFVLLVFMGLVSCQKNEPISPKDSVVTPVSYAPIQIQDMAYTSASELQSLYDNNPTEVIHFNVARLIAETELLAGANFVLAPTIDPNEEWYLTPLPKVVYNYNNTPKYYEFGYVYNGQIVATITTYAQKEIDGVIAYIFNDPLDYSCPDLDFYVGNYPDRYYGQNGECYLKNCDEPLNLENVFSLESSIESTLQEFMFSTMEQSDIEAMQEDMDEEETVLNSEQTDTYAYWSAIDNYIANAFPHLLSEDCNIEPTPLLLEQFQNGSIDAGHEDHANLVQQLVELLDYALGYCNTFTLPNYSDPMLQATHWRGYCGPAACAWVYRGWCAEYDGMYLPIYGDGTDASRHFYQNGTLGYAYYCFANVAHSTSVNSTTATNNFISHSNEADNGLTACFYDNTVPFIYDGQWEFPLYHGGLNRGFSAATGEATGLRVKFTCKPYDYLFYNHQPIIIAVNCNHYVVAFGYGATLKNNGDVKDKYFMVTDNGNTISSTGYHPYMRRYNFWNLHYRVYELTN